MLWALRDHLVRCADPENHNRPMTSATTTIVAISLTSLVSVGVILALVNAVWGPLRGESPSEAAAYSRDADVRDRALETLAREGAFGRLDAFPDPDVARTFQPGLRKQVSHGHWIECNARGVRDRSWTRAKPEGLVRVLLLGDERICAPHLKRIDLASTFLQKLLRDRSRESQFDLECLNVAVEGWNLEAAATFVRRQLSELQPDLVIQVIGEDDLDDVGGVRGFGRSAPFSPRFRMRGDVRLSIDGPKGEDPEAPQGFLAAGLDFESRERFRSARKSLERFKLAIERENGRFLLCVQGGEWWFDSGWVLSEGWPSGEVLVLPKSDTTRESQWQLAKTLYGRIQSGRFLERLNLSPWPMASTSTSKESTHTSIEQALAGVEKRHGFLPGQSLRFPVRGKARAQIHGGVNAEGKVSPFASVILRSGEKGLLRIEAHGLKRAELGDLVIEVRIEGHRVGEIALGSEESKTVEFELPDDVPENAYVTVQFLSSDYVYEGEEADRCLSFVLSGVELT